MNTPYTGEQQPVKAGESQHDNGNPFPPHHQGEWLKHFAIAVVAISIMAMVYIIVTT